MKFFAHSVVVLLLTSSLQAQGGSEIVDSLQIGRLPGGDSDTVAVPKLRLYDPVKVGTASLVIPGLGQVYTQHYVKAFFFIGIEVLFGSMAYFWNQSAAVQEETTAQYLAKAQSDVASGFSTKDSAEDFELSRFSHYSAINNRFSGYNFLTWTIGAHIYNTLDAIDASNYFKNERERNPGTAFLLAAIPGLGLGQIYNGAWSKAGLVIMGQWSLGMMAFNNQRLMVQAENNFERLNTPLTDSTANSIRSQVAEDLSASWASARYTAFSNRNMFMWYSIFFYGYSIFDAVVDAYLHDYPEKMQIKPDLAVGTKSIEFSLQTKF
jgi:hypothetical protein